MQTPNITIVTPLYNSEATLARYLGSVFRSSYRDFEVILVDDCSACDYRGIIQDFPVVYTKLSKRGGSAAARNAGTKLAHGEILLFIDPDIIIGQDSLQKVVEVFHSHPEIDALIGSYDADPGARNNTSRFKFLFHHYIHQREGDYVFSFWTGFGAIKRTTFETISGFDACFFSRPNTIFDVELGYRLIQKGYRIYNAKQIQVKHLKRLAYFQWLRTDIMDRALPWIKIILTYRDLKPRLNIRFGDSLSSLCIGGSIILFCLPHEGHAVVAAGFLLVPLFINHRTIYFFVKQRGVSFGLLSILYLYIYYFMCFIIVPLGVFLFLLERAGVRHTLW